jgi:Zn-dependent M28 family amino/carboxypeptidase
VFVLFGGEEEGLLGSKFFVAHPPQGLKRCVGVFNLDMEGVGRGAWVAGGKNFPELFELLENARDRLEPGLKLIAGRSEGEARSDHGPFQAAGIPAVSLFGASESHHGTHTPEDSIWFVAPANMQAVGRIVFDAAVHAADSR